MKRREAVKLTSMLLGSSLIGSSVFLAGCEQTLKNQKLFAEKDLDLLNEIGETILPATERSPGAKAANVGQFIKEFVMACYRENEQDIFIDGIAEIDQRSKEAYGKGFLSLSEEQRIKILTHLDQLARRMEQTDELHFYSMIKQLTILGYFSSEIGVTQALRYDPIPGRYNGCVPYKKGGPAWHGPISSIG